MESKIFEKIEIPEKNSPISKEQGEFIYSFLKQKNIKKTLEVGFCFGVSTSYIMNATKSRHIAIDPYQKKLWKNRGINNMSKLELEKLLRFENDFSHNVLPKLFNEGVKIDFAFIDGSHLFDYIMLDFFYIDLLLNKNGYVLFDDTWMNSTKFVESWIKNNRKDYEMIEKKDNLLLFQKTGYDEREWSHFIGF